MMDEEGLPAALERPLIKRAMEDLKMLTQSELEYERYESRRKAQLDENTLRNAAQREMEAAQREMEAAQREMEAAQREVETARREIQKSIRFCELMLDRPETPTDQLAPLSLEELSRLAEELQAESLKRKSANG